GWYAGRGGPPREGHVAHAAGPRRRGTPGMATAPHGSSEVGASRARASATRGASLAGRAGPTRAKRLPLPPALARLPATMRKACFALVLFSTWVRAARADVPRADPARHVEVVTAGKNQEAQLLESVLLELLTRLDVNARFARASEIDARERLGRRAEA